MTPLLLEQSLLIGQLLLKYGPGVAAAAAAIFDKKEVTSADWAVVFERAKTPFETGLKEGVLIQDRGETAGSGVPALPPPA